MKKDEVRVGQTYTAKVSGGVAQVQIREEKWKGDKHTGWVGVNLATNRSVYIKSALRLRGRVEGAAQQPEQPGKAAKLAVAPTTPDVGLGRAESGGVVLAKSGSPRPPKAGKAPTKGKGAKAPKSAKKKRVAPAKRELKPRKKADGKMSGLDAAAKVLSESKEPMRVSEIVEKAKSKGYWESRAGKTPEATIYAAVIREIRDKGANARFVKKDRGLFAASGSKQ
jgi:hypothetical protein